MNIKVLLLVPFIVIHASTSVFSMKALKCKRRAKTPECERKMIGCIQKGNVDIFRKQSPLDRVLQKVDVPSDLIIAIQDQLENYSPQAGYDSQGNLHLNPSPFEQPFLTQMLEHSPKVALAITESACNNPNSLAFQPIISSFQTMLTIFYNNKEYRENTQYKWGKKLLKTIWKCLTKIRARMNDLLGDNFENVELDDIIRKALETQNRNLGPVLAACHAELYIEIFPKDQNYIMTQFQLSDIEAPESDNFVNTDLDEKELEKQRKERDRLSNEWDAEMRKKRFSITIQSNCCGLFSGPSCDTQF